MESEASPRGRHKVRDMGSQTLDQFAERIRLNTRQGAELPFINKPRAVKFRHRKSILLSPILLLILLFVTSCGDVGMMVSDITTYNGFDVLKFDTVKNQDKIFSTISEIGNTLGYSVSVLNRRKGIITLAKDAGLFMGVMVGKIDKSTVQFSITNGGKVIEIEILLIGNFNAGGNEAATRILDQFKSRLKRRMSS